MENTDVITWLASGVWVLALVLIYGMVAGTYILIVEKKRRTRTDDKNDDWKLTGN